MVLSTRATCHATRGLAAAAASLAAAVAGCGEPTAPPPLTPADVTGTYVLASLDGVALPAPFGEGTTIVADTTWYAADGTWRSITVSGVVGGGLVPRSVGRYSGLWRLDASRAILYEGSPSQNVGEVLEIPFTVRERGRALEWRGRSGVWRYVRVP